MFYLERHNDSSVLAGEIARIEGFPAKQVAYSPDGRFILAGGDGICLWDALWLKELFRDKSAHGTIRSVAFSPDSKYFICGGDDGLARLWDVEKWTDLLQYKFGDPIDSIAFSPNGMHILAGGLKSQKAILWDTGSERELRRFEGHTGGIKSLAFSPCGRYFMSADRMNIHMWSIQSGQQIRRFIGHEDDVLGLAFSNPHGCTISASKDKTIRLWDTKSGKQLHVFEGHTDAVCAISFSPKGRMMLSGGNDKMVILWDMFDRRWPVLFENHTDCVDSVAFSPDGYFAISGSRDGTIRLWSLRNFCSAKSGDREFVN